MFICSSDPFITLKVIHKIDLPGFFFSSLTYENLYIPLFLYQTEETRSAWNSLFL